MSTTLTDDDSTGHDIVNRRRHTNLAIVRILVQLQTVFGNDLVDIGSVQDEQ